MVRTVERSMLPSDSIGEVEGKRRSSGGRGVEMRIMRKSGWVRATIKCNGERVAGRGAHTSRRGAQLCPLDLNYAHNPCCGIAFGSQKISVSDGSQKKATPS